VILESVVSHSIRLINRLGLLVIFAHLGCAQQPYAWASTDFFYAGGNSLFVSASTYLSYPSGNEYLAFADVRADVSNGSSGYNYQYCYYSQFCGASMAFQTSITTYDTTYILSTINTAYAADYNTWSWAWNYGETRSAYVPYEPPNATYETPLYSGSTYPITITGVGFDGNPAVSSNCNVNSYIITWAVTPDRIDGNVWLSPTLAPCQLEITVQGQSVAYIQLALSTPTGEESYALNQQGMAGVFAARLNPDAAAVWFLGRTVRETILVHDYCYFPGGPRDRLPDTFKNDMWSVDSYNYYAGGTGRFGDLIGLRNGDAWVQAWESYFYDTGWGTCSLSGTQNMYIDGITAPYESHDAGLYLGYGFVYAVRGNASVWISY
jgi:hypothetical protein